MIKDCLFYQIFQEPLDKWWGQIPEDEYWFPVIIATLKFHLIDKWWGKLKKKDKKFCISFELQQNPI